MKRSEAGALYEVKLGLCRLIIMAPVPNSCNQTDQTTRLAAAKALVKRGGVRPIPCVPQWRTTLTTFLFRSLMKRQSRPSFHRRLRSVVSPCGGANASHSSSPTGGFRLAGRSESALALPEVRRRDENHLLFRRSGGVRELLGHLGEPTSPPATSTAGAGPPL